LTSYLLAGKYDWEGHDLGRAITAAKSMRLSAAEVCLRGKSRRFIETATGEFDDGPNLFAIKAVIPLPNVVEIGSRLNVLEDGGGSSLPSCRQRSMLPTLKRGQPLVWAFDFVLGIEEFFTPWLACALGALVNHVAHSEAVIAGPVGAGPRELIACLAGREGLNLEGPVFAP
jgi:hypothetical protein